MFYMVMFGLFLVGFAGETADLKFSDHFVTQYGLCGSNDQLGNTWIEAASICDDNLEVYLIDYEIESKGKAIVTMIDTRSVQELSKIKILHLYRFRLFHAYEDGRLEYIFRNGSSIPAPMTAVCNAEGIVVRTTREKIKEVLVVQERARPDQCGFVGGPQEMGELNRETILRKTQEKVGLRNIRIEYMLAQRSRKKANRYGANEMCAFYLLYTQDLNEQLKLQQREIASALWAPVQDILERKWDQLPLSKEFVFLLNHATNGKTYKYMSQQDMRQNGKQNSDPTDIMDYELFVPPQ